MTALCVTAGILILIFVLFIIHIRADFSLSVIQKETEIYLNVKYLFLSFKILPSEEKTQKSESEEKSEKAPKKATGKKKSVREYISVFRGIKDILKDALNGILRYFFRHAVTIESLNVSADIGTGDAMQTGVIIGAANGLAYGTVGAVQRNMKLKSFNVSIDGNFDEEALNAGVDCVVWTNIIHILALGAIGIRAAIRIFFRLRRIKKNG